MNPNCRECKSCKDYVNECYGNCRSVRDCAVCKFDADNCKAKCERCKPNDPCEKECHGCNHLNPTSIRCKRCAECKLSNTRFGQRNSDQGMRGRSPRRGRSHSPRRRSRSRRGRSHSPRGSTKIVYHRPGRFNRFWRTRYRFPRYYSYYYVSPETKCERYVERIDAQTPLTDDQKTDLYDVCVSRYSRYI